jgi:general secretion pathway protein N
VLSHDGKPLGTAQWQLSRRALLGDPVLRLQFDGSSLTFSGFARKLTDQKIEAHDVHVRAELSDFALPTQSPLGQPRGTLTVNVSHAVLQGGWPMDMALKAQWTRAVVQTLDGEVALGTLALEAKSSSGIIQAALHDVGEGPLSANGRVQLSPLGWRLDATLSSRRTDLRLDRWLAQFGPPAADGSVHIRQTGGLVGTLPPPGAAQEPKQP